LNKQFLFIKTSFMTDQLNEGVPYPNTISLEEGIAITTNWRNYMESQGAGPDFIRAFFIPVDDIKFLYELTVKYGGEGIRAYIGLAEADKPSSAKLALVPTSGPEPGADILDDPNDDFDSTIFDFTQPCPQACDFGSPLFTGG
jgi:hypothetical protein